MTHAREAGHHFRFSAAARASFTSRCVNFPVYNSTVMDNQQSGGFNLFASQYGSNDPSLNVPGNHGI